MYTKCIQRRNFALMRQDEVIRKVNYSIFQLKIRGFQILITNRVSTNGPRQYNISKAHKNQKNVIERFSSFSLCVCS